MSTKSNVANSSNLENVVEMTAETVIVLYEIGIETDTDSGQFKQDTPCILLRYFILLCHGLLCTTQYVGTQFSRYTGSKLLLFV